MKNSTERFLEFNGKAISFLSVDGQWWVAIKPICDALTVNYNRQAQNIREDQILSQLVAEQQLVAADGKLRKMICLPEKFIYGWLFSIQSDSASLLEFKQECYEVLFDHFHGGVRGKLKTTKLKNHAQIEHLQKLVDQKMQEDENFAMIGKLKAENISIGQQLSKLEKEEDKNQLDLFRTMFQ